MWDEIKWDYSKGFPLQLIALLLCTRPSPPPGVCNCFDQARDCDRLDLSSVWPGTSQLQGGAIGTSYLALVILNCAQSKILFLLNGVVRQSRCSQWRMRPEVRWPAGCLYSLGRNVSLARSYPKARKPSWWSRAASILAQPCQSTRLLAYAQRSEVACIGEPALLPVITQCIKHLTQVHKWITAELK
jgi:hypothetical protein